MDEKKIRRIIILEKEKLVGIITDKDIIRSLVNNKELLSTTVGAHLPISEDKLKNEISQFGSIILSSIRPIINVLVF